MATPCIYRASSTKGGAFFVGWAGGSSGVSTFVHTDIHISVEKYVNFLRISVDNPCEYVEKPCGKDVGEILCLKFGKTVEKHATLQTQMRESSLS